MKLVNQDVKNLQLILKVMSDSRVEVAGSIFNRILDRNPELQQVVVGRNAYVNDCEKIIMSVKSFITC